LWSFYIKWCADRVEFVEYATRRTLSLQRPIQDLLQSAADGIKRFARPIAYQNWANELLPDEIEKMKIHWESGEQ